MPPRFRAPGRSAAEARRMSVAWKYGNKIVRQGYRAGVALRGMRSGLGGRVFRRDRQGRPYNYMRLQTRLRDDAHDAWEDLLVQAGAEGPEDRLLMYDFMAQE